MTALANAIDPVALLNFQARMGAYNAQQQGRQQNRQNAYSSQETDRLLQMLQAQQAQQMQWDMFNRQQQNAYGGREFDMLLKLLENAERQQANARQDNVSRYNDILQDRVDTSERLLGQVDQFGQSLIADTDRAFDTTRNNRLASLSSRGLLGSTVADSVNLRTERERQDAQRRNRDTLLQNRIGLDERQSEGIQGFMERRTDAYPDTSNLTALAAQAAQRGGFGGGGVRGGGSGFGPGGPVMPPTSPFGLPTPVGSGLPTQSPRPVGAFGLHAQPGRAGATSGPGMGLNPPMLWPQPAPAPRPPGAMGLHGAYGSVRTPSMRASTAPPQLNPGLPAGQQYDRMGNLVAAPRPGMMTQQPTSQEIQRQALGVSPQHNPAPGVFVLNPRVPGQSPSAAPVMTRVNAPPAGTNVVNANPMFSQGNVQSMQMPGFAYPQLPPTYPQYPTSPYTPPQQQQPTSRQRRAVQQGLNAATPFFNALAPFNLQYPLSAYNA